jgi:hypothetical protein
MPEAKAAARESMIAKGVGVSVGREVASKLPAQVLLNDGEQLAGPIQSTDVSEIAKGLAHRINQDWLTKKGVPVAIMGPPRPDIELEFANSMAELDLEIEKLSARRKRT